MKKFTKLQLRRFEGLHGMEGLLIREYLQGSMQKRRLLIISYYLLVFLIMSEHRQITTM